MHFYRFHVADYVSHTRHLSRMEDLAYRRMLDHAYLHERGLAGDAEAVARIIDLRDLVAEVAAVLKEFWLQDASGVWRNNRVEKELALMADKQAKAIAAGKASANARSTGVQRTFNGRSTDVEHPFNGRSTIQDSKTPRLQDTTTQDASTQEPSTEAPLRVARSSVLFPMEAPPKKLRDMTVDEVGHEPGFVKFWNAYGRKQGKRDAAKAWKAINPDEALVDEIVRCAATYAATIEPGKEQFQALPATWLNGRRWEDAPVKRTEPDHGKRPHGFDKFGKWHGPRDDGKADYSAPIEEDDPLGMHPKQLLARENGIRASKCLPPLTMAEWEAENPPGSY